MKRVAVCSVRGHDPESKRFGSCPRFLASWRFVFLAYCVLRMASSGFAEEGTGLSPKGPLDIRKPDQGNPKLRFSASLTRGPYRAEQPVVLAVTIRNEGDGEAQGVRIVLSGTSWLVRRFDAEKIIGAITAGQTIADTLRVTLPSVVPAETGKTFVVSVKEAREEYSCEPQPFEVGILPRGGTGGPVKTYSPVDFPPEPRQRDPNAVALVIGVPRLRDMRAESLPARNDAEVMAVYLKSVCGVAPDNLKLLIGEPTRTDIERAIENWLPRKVRSGGRAFIYFAGHGTHDENGKAYLVPYDGDPNDLSSLYGVDQLVAKANDLAATDVVAILDACFSGSNRSVQASGRAAFVPVKMPEKSCKCVVLAAADSNQTAYDLASAKHGLFTYYVLLGLRGEADGFNGGSKDGWITLKELYDYVAAKVSVTAAEELLKEQKPTVIPPEMLQTKGGIRIGKSQ